MSETILIVDDEEPVRRTFTEWLTQARLGVTILTASDAESALQLANKQPIDLAILDWALGAGDDGLQLLQDLYAFHPDVVAIMVTGFANQATPLDAMRMGVRDYLDKNHDLNRDTFVAAVTRQLEQIRPARRARQLNRSLLAFRETVEKVLPLVQSAAALNDPVPLPDAVRVLVRFLIQATRARDGLLLIRHYDVNREPAEICQVFDAAGEKVAGPLVPFNRSVAGTAVSLGQPCMMNELDGVELQPFERGKRRLLAVPLAVAAGTQVVIELFDKEGDFSAADQKFARAAGELGTELLRQALGQRQTHRLLLDAVVAALGATEPMTQTLHDDAEARRAQPPPPEVLAQLRAGLSREGDETTARLSIDLAEAIRVLAARHGQPALQHCLRLVAQVRELLDTVTGG